jgi:hypothetical protein
MNLQAQFDQWYNSLLSRGGVIASSNAQGSGRGLGYNPHMTNYKSEASHDRTEVSNWDSIGANGDIARTVSNASIARSAPKIAEHKEVSLHHSSSDNISFKGISNVTSATLVDDADVNEDILAFYKAKEELLKRRSQQGR